MLPEASETSPAKGVAPSAFPLNVCSTVSDQLPPGMGEISQTAPQQPPLLPLYSLVPYKLPAASKTTPPRGELPSSLPVMLNSTLSVCAAALAAMIKQLAVRRVNANNSDDFFITGSIRFIGVLLRKRGGTAGAKLVAQSISLCRSSIKRPLSDCICNC